MFKNIFFAGLTASIFGTIISFAYINVFKYSQLEADFTEKASFAFLISFNMTIGMITCFVYFALVKILKKERIAAFIVGLLLSGIAIILSLKFMFTVDTELVFKNENANAFKDYYYFILAPVAFFPALSWFTFKPLFIK